MNVRRKIYYMVFGGMLCCEVLAVAPEQFVDISASGLLYEAGKNLSAENYAGAVPYLTHYLERMEPIEENRVVALKQSVRLKLGKIFAHMEDPFTASDYLKQYTETLPCYKPREAWKLLSLTLFESGQFEPCVDAVGNALTRPLPKGLPNKEKELNYDELSKNEMAGFTARQIKRIEEEAAAEGETISEAISEGVPDPEPDYTMEELVFLNTTLAEAHTKLENWDASIEPYEFVIENAIAGDRKGYAIMQLVNSLIALERFDDAKDFIVKLYNTNARYDIRVNMALMSAAAELLGEAEYDSALMLYRMILPRSDMVAYQVTKLNELRREAGLPRVETQTSTNDMGRVETLFGNTSADLIETDNAFAAGLPDKPLELVKLEESVAVLLSLQPYEDDVLYRTGLLFARAGRPWEAVAALDYIVGRDPDSAKGQDAFVESLMVLLDPLEKYELVEERSMQFLSTYSAGRGPRRVAHALTGSYQKQERWKEIKKLRPVIEKFDPSTDSSVLQYECELWYMQAIADMVLLDYKGCLAGFAKVLRDFPDSHQQESATHWHAMSQLFLQNIPEALEELEAYIAAYPEGSFLPTSEFHCGICLFGLEKYDEALARFTEVVEKYPDALVYSDASAMRGDVLASKGEIELAELAYREAIAKAKAPRQATYAVFQLSTMFELELRYDEIIAAVTAYLDR
jgi:tetratricopeptide (TPR) repeat protein